MIFFYKNSIINQIDIEEKTQFQPPLKLKNKN